MNMLPLVVYSGDVDPPFWKQLPPHSGNLTPLYFRVKRGNPGICAIENLENVIFYDNFMG